MLCDKTKEHTADILILQEWTITLVFLDQEGLANDVPFHLNLALEVPTHSKYADFDSFLHITSQP